MKIYETPEVSVLGLKESDIIVCSPPKDKNGLPIVTSKGTFFGYDLYDPAMNDRFDTK